MRKKLKLHKPDNSLAFFQDLKIQSELYWITQRSLYYLCTVTISFIGQTVLLNY